MIIAESRSKFIELLDVMMFAYLRLLLASGFSSSLFVSSLVSIEVFSSPSASANALSRRTTLHI